MARAEGQLATGVWTGRYTNTFENLCRFQDSGAVTLTIDADGASRVRIDGLEIRMTSKHYPYEGGTCSLIDTVAVSGTGAPMHVEGTTITGSWHFVDADYGSMEWPWTANLTGDRLVGTWTCSKATPCVGGFTLTLAEPAR
jgi:hypothetical protein